MSDYLSLTNYNYYDIITKTNKLLTVEELLDEVQYPLNKIYFDKLFYHIENDKWIYINEEMLKWMGFNNIDKRDNKKHYINLLKENFIDNNEYNILNSIKFKEFLCGNNFHIENNNINLHNKTKHLIISPDCFKQSLMLLKTKKSKEIRNYYIELEKIFKFYLKYQTEYQKYLTNKVQKQLEQEKNKNEEITQLFINPKPLTLGQYIYVVSSIAYFKYNIFKIGMTTNIYDRLKIYQIGRIQNEKFEYVYILRCHNAKWVEKYIFALLEQFQYIENNKVVNEVYQIHFDVLEKIFKIIEENEYNNIYNINNLIEQYPLLCNNKSKQFDEVAIFNKNEYLLNKYNMYEENKLDKYYQNAESRSKLTNEIINEEFEKYKFRIISDYTGKCDDQYEFECLSIFKHKFSMTYSHAITIKERGCYFCTKHGILDQVPIYRYHKDTYIFDKKYLKFEDIKNDNPEIKFQMIKNNIREKRWLCNVNGYIYSILSPDNGNKLNLEKELTNIEKEIINILDINYNSMKNKVLDQYQSYIYIIDNENKQIKKVNNNYTYISNNVYYKNGKNKINRKIISKKINTNKEYAGYIWTTNLDKDKYFNYEIISI